jgi:hypothetical protein
VPNTIGLVMVENGSGTDAVTLGNGTLAGFSAGTKIDLNSYGTGESSVFVSGIQEKAAVTIDPGWILYNGVRINYAGPGLSCGNVEIATGNGSQVDAVAVLYHTTVTVDVGPYDDVFGPAVDQIIVHRRPVILPPPGGGGGTTGNAGGLG